MTRANLKDLAERIVAGRQPDQSSEDYDSLCSDAVVDLAHAVLRPCDRYCWELSELRAERDRLKEVVTPARMHYGHPSWNDKSQQEVLDALRFQGACTKALMEFMEKHVAEIKALRFQLQEIREAYERTMQSVLDKPARDAVHRIAGLQGHLIDLTARMTEHPEGYDGPCFCLACKQYGAEDGPSEE